MDFPQTKGASASDGPGKPSTLGPSAVPFAALAGSFAANAMTKALKAMTKASKVTAKALKVMTKALKVMAKASKVMTKASKVMTKASKVMAKALNAMTKAWKVMTKVANAMTKSDFTGAKIGLLQRLQKLSCFDSGARSFMPKLHTVALILAVLTQMASGEVPRGLAYSGETRWDAATATFTFKSSGKMPDGKENFFWQVPPEVKRIHIDRNVTVQGAFRVGFRTPENPLHIIGGDRKTSVVFGTESERWTASNGVADNERWKYGAVSSLADSIVHVSNLTSKNPRGYHISGYANRSVLHVSQCDLVDTRPGPNNNSDGFIGSAGSTISDCFISTGDDAIKAYHDVVIRNVTIDQHRNGAPIQFGWGGESGRAKVDIENLTINGASKDKLYNMAPFTWEAGRSGVRNVTIKGLKIRLAGKLYDETTRNWLPIGLFELKPAQCTVNLTATDADIGLLQTGIRQTLGIITINGKQLP